MKIIPSYIQILDKTNGSSSNNTVTFDLTNHKRLYQSQLSLERVLYFSLIVTVLLLIAIILICISIRLGNDNTSADVSDKDVQLCVSSMSADTKPTAATGDSPNHSDDDLVESDGRRFGGSSDQEESAFTHLLSNSNRYHFINNGICLESPSVCQV
mmetsp:Transcript_20586/g.29490  ORF Transcript_20586/g.29490 Transcript_20586/m.29490 type:complete len:156 (-) Transcript_20586:122-589(-)